MPTRTNHNLTNEQRTRLEQIAKDEFAIRKREVENEKFKTFQEWKKAEVKRIETSAAAKQFFKHQREATKIQDKLMRLGFTISVLDNKPRCIVRDSINYDKNNVAINKHPKVDEMSKKTRVDNDAFTRALNEVLAVIWSMEQSFTECINLIKTQVSKIK